MDLSTTYLGFRLPHPLMPGASPLADDLDTVRRLEDAGASAIVMRSLFEEQIVRDELATYRAHEATGDSYAEALSYLPEPETFSLGTHEYLEQLQRIKAAVAVPVIASLNGTTPQGWMRERGAGGAIAPRPWEDADLVLPHAQCLVVSDEDIEPFQKDALEWFQQVPLGAVTRASQGAFLFVNGERYHVAADAAAEVDPTGLVPIGNPPSGAAGGYGWFDLTAIILSPALVRAWWRLTPRPDPVADPAA